jgi:hypothetical protein
MRSPGAWHGLASAITLAKVLNAQLDTVTVVEPSTYEPYVGVIPFFSQILKEGQIGILRRAAAEGCNRGERHDIALQTPHRY